MFCEIAVELNGRNVGDSSQLHPYRSIIESLLNYCKKTQQTRLLCEGLTQDTTRHMNVTAVGENNACLNARAATFARSTVVEFVGRPHTDVFHQDRLIPPNIDLYIQLMLFLNNFMSKSAAPAQGAVQENYKLVIQSVNFIIRIKQLTSTALKAHMELLHLQNIIHHYTRVQMKHLAILTNQTSINFGNIFTGDLPDLVIVGLVSDADLAGGYQNNLFNFQNLA